MPGPLPMVPTAVPGWRPGAGRPTLPIAANSRPGLPRELMNRLVTEAVPDLGVRERGRTPALSMTAAAYAIDIHT
jgi:hypothetical protein